MYQKHQHVLNDIDMSPVILMAVTEYRKAFHGIGGRKNCQYIF